MHILFDFDGTLVDSFECVMKKALLLAEEFSLKKIPEQELDRLRDLSSLDIIKLFNVSLYKLPALIGKMREHIRQEVPNLPPVAGIVDVLQRLYAEKFTLGILTSNSVDNVERWLNLNDLRALFSFIHSESNFFSKKQLIKKTLVQYQINKSQVIYIGDETRDIDAARKNKISSLAVTWGYNSEKILLKSEPTFIAKVPKDIPLIIEPTFGS